LPKLKCYTPLGISITGNAVDVLKNLDQVLRDAEKDSFMKLEFKINEEKDLELWGIPPESPAEREAKRAKRRKQFERLKKEFGVA
jgi:hypothetical protein